MGKSDETRVRVGGFSNLWAPGGWGWGLSSGPRNPPDTPACLPSPCRRHSPGPWQPPCWPGKFGICEWKSLDQSWSGVGGGRGVGRSSVLSFPGLASSRSEPGKRLNASAGPSPCLPCSARPLSDPTLLPHSHLQSGQRCNRSHSGSP